MFENGFLNFNHGGFGATPRPVRQAMEAFTDRMETQPTAWFGGGGYRAVLDQVRPLLARLLGANSSDVVFLDNASAGLTAVLRSMDWKRGDVLLLTDAAYAVIPNTADWLERRYGIRTLRARIEYPVSGPESYVEPVRQLLAELSQAERSRVRLAVFDHISSYPAVVLPVAELAQLVKRATGGRGLVMLDGAHALGQVPVDVEKLRKAGVDFWVGDGHKWLLSPRGSAVLWAARPAQALLEPDVISSDNAPGTAFQERFDYIGTRDYTPWCAVGAALDFRTSLGGDGRIHGYIHELAVWAGEMLASRLGTEVLAPPSMTPAMTNVRLPIPPSWPAEEQRRCASAVGEDLAAKDRMQLITFTLRTTSGEGGSARVERETHWARISAQVYLERADFERLASRILSRVAGCSHGARLDGDLVRV